MTEEKRKHARVRTMNAISYICVDDDGNQIDEGMGTTVDISQGGAFIETRDWSAFQENDQALVTFDLPPKFTGQDVIIHLLGTAIIKRIDRENEGLGLQFKERLRQFERVH